MDERQPPTAPTPASLGQSRPLPVRQGHSAHPHAYDSYLRLARQRPGSRAALVVCRHQDRWFWAAHSHEVHLAGSTSQGHGAAWQEMLAAVLVHPAPLRLVVGDERVRVHLRPLKTLLGRSGHVLVDVPSHDKDAALHRAALHAVQVDLGLRHHVAEPFGNTTHGPDVPLVVATDGSMGAMGSKHAGWAWADASGRTRWGKVRAKDILLVELTAIHQAIVDHPVRDLVVHTDSAQSLAVLRTAAGERRHKANLPSLAVQIARAMARRECYAPVRLAKVGAHGQELLTAPQVLNDAADRLSRHIRRGSGAKAVVQNIVAETVERLDALDPMTTT